MRGRLALVLDAPVEGRGPFNGASGEILGATLRAVLRAAGDEVPDNLLDLVDVYYATDEPTPGNKPPKIALIRAGRERLLAELSAARPAMVLSVGAAGCTSLSGEKKAVAITRWRGMMRWLELESGRVPWVPTISSGSVAARSVLYRDFVYDVWKAWTQPEPLAAPDVEIVVPRDFAALEASLAPLRDASVVSCDVETTGLRPYRDRLLSVGFGADYGDGSGYAVIVPFELLSDPRVVDACWDVAYTRSRRTVFQNGKFDVQYLTAWAGDETPHEAFLGDTLLLGSLLDERPKKDRIGGLGLKEQAAIRYDKPDYHWDWEHFYGCMAADTKAYAESGETAERWPTTDWDGLYGYQALDVYFTTRLWFDLVTEAEAESPRIMRAHDEVMIPAMKVLAACELAGAPLDRDWLRGFAEWLGARIARREGALERVVAALGAPEGFKIGSAKEVADLMYDTWGMTPDVRRKLKFNTDGSLKADRSTDKEHIKAAIAKYGKSKEPRLRRASRWLRTLLRWRADIKNLSTYSTTLLEKADDDGRVRAEFLLHGTSTGRLSSSRPNLQNIPAVDDKKEVNGRRVYTLRGGVKTFRPARRGFAPPRGYLWVEADYSQLELRVAAWLSGDERLRQVFIDGEDIHLQVAATMFSKPASEISKPERYLAKAVDFGILYGRTGKALAEGAEMDYYERELRGKRWDEPTANAFISKFLRGYPQLSRWLEETAAFALSDYHVETPFGRRRRFPFRPRSKYERLAIARQATNTPIQSAASDLCLQAMFRIKPHLPEGATMLFPVHDSICLEVREDLINEVTEILRREMEIEVGGVPLTVDVEVGVSWADVGAR